MSADQHDARRRSWLPLAVAAVLVVVALLGVGLLFADRGGEQGTVADDGDAPVETGGGEISRLALDDPAALGYEVRAAFSPEPAPPGADASATTHGPAGSDEPWGAAIASLTGPMDERAFTGERVDIGPPEAVYRQLGHVASLAWRSGSDIQQLLSARVGRDRLVAIARDAVSDGWSGEGPLPGHDVLHAGASLDLAPGLEFAGRAGSPWQGIAYASTGADRGFVIGWRRGGEALLQASHLFDPSPRVADVSGATAHVSDGALDRPSFATWRTDPGTVVQVVTYEDIDGVLEVLAQHLAPIDAASFDRLQDSHPVPDGAVLLERPGGIFDGEGSPVAQLEVSSPDGGQHRVEILRRADALGLLVEREHEGMGSSGSGGPLADLETPFLQAGREGDPNGGPPTAPVVVAGVAPPGAAEPGTVAVVDRASGASLELLQVAWGAIPGSDHRLFIALVETDTEDFALDMTFQTTDGERTWRL